MRCISSRSMPCVIQSDLGHAKMWTWQGDPVPLALFKAYGITPIPLTLPDVLPSLQSGLIDTFYGPPLAILALQWFTKARYISALPITYVMGAFILSKQQWQNSPEQQTLVRETMTKYNAKIVTTMRHHQQKALTLLQTLAKSVTMSEQRWPTSSKPVSKSEKNSSANCTRGTSLSRSCSSVTSIGRPTHSKRDLWWCYTV